MKPVSIVLLLVCCLAGAAFSQNIGKGSVVTPKFSRTVIEFEKIKINLWNGQAKAKLSGTVTQEKSGHMSINGDPMWNIRGFPWMQSFVIKELKVTGKNGGHLLTVDGGLAQIELSFNASVDMTTAMNELFFAGTPESYANTEEFKVIESVLLPRVFKGGLATIPRETQRRYLESLNYNDMLVHEAIFKDKSYIAQSVENLVTYNTLQLNAPERVSRTTETLLTTIRSAFQTIGDMGGVAGLKFQTKISYKSFLERFASPSEDTYEIYVPRDLLQKFVNAEITNQELIDGSVVLVNGSRVKVNLTNFS